MTAHLTEATWSRAEATLAARREGKSFASVRAALGWYYEARQRLQAPNPRHPHTEPAPYRGELGESRSDTRVLLAASEGRIRCVTATTVADEGLDLPGLDALLLATPCSPKATGRLQQRVGRICRPRAGKRQPLVVDAVDPGLEKLFKTRMKLYEKLGASA